MNWPCSLAWEHIAIHYNCNPQAMKGVILVHCTYRSRSLIYLDHHTSIRKTDNSCAWLDLDSNTYLLHNYHPPQQAPRRQPEQLRPDVVLFSGRSAWLDTTVLFRGFFKQLCIKYIDKHILHIDRHMKTTRMIQLDLLHVLVIPDSVIYSRIKTDTQCRRLVHTCVKRKQTCDYLTWRIDT
jgi:hypothetical protein